MDPVFMERLEQLRERWGKPMRINSAYRCAEHNGAVSKTGRTGPHVTGQAVDIAVWGEDAYELVRLALDGGFTGIGVYQDAKVLANRHLHLDTCPSYAPDFITGITYARPRIW
jgi:uncharacterized protein YcbK (DUF882 family)